MREPATGDHNDPIEEVRLRRSLLLPISLVVFVTVAIAASVYLLVLREEETPHRVLVLISAKTLDGQTSRWWTQDDPTGLSRALSKAVNDALTEMRFDTFDFNTRSLQKTLRGATDDAALLAAAADLRVGHLVLGSVEVSEQQPVKGTERIRRTLRLDWAVVDVASGTRTPVLPAPLEVHISSQDEADALNAAPATTVPLMLTHVMLALGQQPKIAALRPKTRKNKSLALQRAGIRLDDFFAFIQIYAEDLAQADADATAALASLRQRDASPLPTPRLPLGSALDQEVYFGPAPGGRVWLMREPHAPTRLIGGSTYSLLRRDEQLILADPDGQNRQVIHTFFSYLFEEAAVSADGAQVATFLEHPHGARELVVIDTTGTARPLYVHIANDYFSPTFSPDGQRVAFIRRDPLRQYTLEVIRADGSQEHPKPLGYETPARPAPPAWTPDSRALYVALRPLRANPSTIWRFDAATGDAAPILGPDAAPPPPVIPPLTCWDGRALDARPCEALAQGALLGLALGAALATDDTPFEQVFAFDDEPPPPPPDLRYDSGFTDVLALPDGQSVLVREVDADGGAHLGRFWLAEGRYARLASLAFIAPKLSPQGDAVALVAPSRRDDLQDPWHEDDEVFVFALPDGPLTQVTRNDHDDLLQGWSASGDALYVGVDTRAADPDPCAREGEACEVLFRVPLR